MKLLHMEIKDCLSCPAYYWREEDESNTAANICHFNACNFPNNGFDEIQVEEGYIASDCPLEDIEKEK